MNRAEELNNKMAQVRELEKTYRTLKIVGFILTKAGGVDNPNRTLYLDLATEIEKEFLNDDD